MIVIYDDPEHVFVLCLFLHPCLDVEVFVFVFGQRHVLFVPQFVLNVCLCSGNGVRCQPWWAELQRFVKWTSMSMDTIHAVLAFLAIRGLGKVKALVEGLPISDQSPSNAVISLVGSAPDIVPSVGLLNERMVQLIKTNLMIHGKFNLAQLLQGENTPANVKNLQEFKEEYGAQTIKFYLFSLVGMMSGVMRGQFMDEIRGRITLLGLNKLKRLGKSSPQEIYRPTAMPPTSENCENLQTPCLHSFFNVWVCFCFSMV